MQGTWTSTPESLSLCINSISAIMCNTCHANPVRGASWKITMTSGYDKIKFTKVDFHNAVSMELMVHTIIQHLISKPGKRWDNHVSNVFCSFSPLSFLVFVAACCLRRLKGSSALRQLGSQKRPGCQHLTNLVHTLQRSRPCMPCRSRLCNWCKYWSLLHHAFAKPFGVNKDESSKHSTMR